MPWCSAEVVLELIARMVKKKPSELADYWPGFAADGLQLGQADLVGVLGAKGYAAAQLESWDHRSAFLKSQAAYRAIELSLALSGLDLERFTHLDRVPSLQDVLAISIGGIPTPPTPGLVGGITHGTITAADTTRADFDPRHLFD
jgi:hypothetical protein